MVSMDTYTEEDLDLMARMRVTIPPKKAGRLELVRFKVEDLDIPAELYYGSRSPSGGEYTKLQERIPGHKQDGILWMSDTPAELADHLPVARRIADPSCKRVLINGLGLGCIAKLACSFDHVESIQVVEMDQRVIKLVGRWMQAEYGDRLQIISGDAYDMKWPPTEEPWDVVWHDIWPFIAEDNLEGMHRLHRMYRSHCTWQGSWAVELCMMMQDVDRSLFKRIAKMEGKLPDENHKLWKDYLDFLEVEHHYSYFAEQGYHAASPDDHPIPIAHALNQLSNWETGIDGTTWKVK
jgi:hypothetical protein